MDCKTFNENIELFIENKLDGQTAEAYNKHLTECDECRKNYIVLKLAVSGNNVSPRSNKIYWAGIAAILLILAGAYIYFINNSRQNNINIADNNEIVSEQEKSADIIISENIAQPEVSTQSEKGNIPQDKIIYSAKLDSYSPTELDKLIKPYFSETDKLAFVKSADAINPLVIIENYDKNIITVYNAPDLKRLFRDSKNQIEQITETIKSEYLDNSEINGVINNIVDFEITEIIICEYKNKILKLKKYQQN